jgi:hypothetical protein
MSEKLSYSYKNAEIIEAKSSYETIKESSITKIKNLKARVVTLDD